jgi:hypothetical protein
MAAPAAEADWRYRRHHDGGAVAAGLIGGLALGSIAGSVIAGSQPAYGYSYGYMPARPRYRPVYAAPRYVYDEPAVYCQWQRQKVWLDRWTYQVRRVKVCH